MESQTHPPLDPLPAPTLDRKSFASLLLATLAAVAVGGTAGAIAPVRDPSAGDPVDAFYRYAEAVDGMVEWHGDDDLIRALQLAQGGVVFWQTDTGTHLSLTGIDRRADPAIAALFNTLADLAASNP